MQLPVAKAFFGLIHSVLPAGGIYLPWGEVLHGSRVPYHWTAAYLVVALMLAGLGRFDRDPAPAR